MRHLKSIYLVNAIEGFAGSLVGIFVPVYFLSIGYSLTQVFVYFIIQNIGTAVFFALAGYLAEKKSLKTLFLVRLPFLFANYALLYLFTEPGRMIYLIGFVSAIQSAFFWFPLNTFFTQHTAEKDLSGNIAKLLSIPAFVCIFAPLFGGFVTSVFGFKTLFVITMGLYILAAIPTFYLPEFKISVSIKFRRLAEMIRKYPRFFVAVILESIGGEADGVIWPIFVFLALKSYVATGTVSTLIALGGAIFTYLIANRTNGVNNRKFLKIGAMAVIIVWLARFTAADPRIVYILSVFAGFAGVLVSTPFHYIIYSSARKDNPAEFLIFREIPVAIGRTILYAACILLIGNLNYSFLLAAGSYLFLLLY